MEKPGVERTGTALRLGPEKTVYTSKQGSGPAGKTKTAEGRATFATLFAYNFIQLTVKNVSIEPGRRCCGTILNARTQSTCWIQVDSLKKLSIDLFQDLGRNSEPHLLQNRLFISRTHLCIAEVVVENGGQTFVQFLGTD